MNRTIVIPFVGGKQVGKAFTSLQLAMQWLEDNYQTNTRGFDLVVSFDYLELEEDEPRPIRLICKNSLFVG